MKLTKRRKLPTRVRRLSLERFERRNLLASVILDLAPTADNTLYEDAGGNLSNGSGQFLFAGRVSTQGSNELRRGLVRFDVSAIPQGSVINSVHLEMTMSRTSAGAQPVSLNRVLGDWGEGSSDAPRQEGAGTVAEPGDATWLYRALPDVLWDSEGGDFDVDPSATTQVDATGRYAWTSDEMVTDVLEWLADPTTNFGWMVLGNETTAGTAKRFDSRDHPLEANRPKLIVDYEVDPTLDFGDAPSGEQAGLPNDYPVTVDQNGARHLVGSLRLGSQVDAELDGVASTGATGEGNQDDGVRFVSSLVSLSSDTTSSVSVIASDEGRIDAWIDFNQDGDWDDPGEQIAARTSVSVGSNVLPLIVPAGALSGDTYARFRLSTLGGLAPNGFASDGEVEDYQLSVLDGGTAPAASLQMVTNQLTLGHQVGDLEVSEEGVTRFRAPLSSVGLLSIEGTDGNDQVVIDLGSDPNFPGPLQIEGGSGRNSLALSGPGRPLDLTRFEFDIRDFSEIDLTNVDETRLTIDSFVVGMLAPVAKHVEIRAGVGDEVIVSDGFNWRLTEPIIVDQQFHLTAVHQATSGESIQALMPRPWQNFLQASDVNNDGNVTALDALLGINELSRQTYSDSQGRLLDPLDVESWPGFYYDQNGDGRASALDSLRVINQLSRENSSAEAEHLPPLVRPQVASDNDEIDMEPRVEFSSFGVLPQRPFLNDAAVNSLLNDEPSPNFEAQPERTGQELTDDSVDEWMSQLTMKLLEQDAAGL